MILCCTPFLVLPFGAVLATAAAPRILARLLYRARLANAIRRRRNVRRFAGDAMSAFVRAGALSLGLHAAVCCSAYLGLGGLGTPRPVGAPTCSAKVSHNLGV